MSADKLPNIQTLLVDEAGNVLGTNANPLVTSGGGGGGGGTVDQGTPNTADNAWSFRLSNGIGFYDGATEAKQDTTNTSLTNIDNQLSDIQTNQTNKTQSAQITDGTNVAALLNAAPTGTEWGLGVRLMAKRLLFVYPLA